MKFSFFDMLKVFVIVGTLAVGCYAYAHRPARATCPCGPACDCAPTCTCG